LCAYREKTYSGLRKGPAASPYALATSQRLDGALQASRPCDAQPGQSQPPARWTPMITFKVVKEQHGWTVRTGEQMSTPFWSRVLAIREADRMAARIRRHGARTEVLIEDVELDTIVLGSVTPAPGAIAGRGPAARP
jgi:hypothetical protein